MEEKYNNDIVIIPNRYFEIPKFELNRSTKKAGKVSYTAIEPPKEETYSETNEGEEERLQPVVKAIVPESKNKRNKSNKSIFGFFKNLIAPIDEVQTTQVDEEQESVANKIEEKDVRPNRENRPRNRRSNFKKRNQRDPRHETAIQDNQWKKENNDSAKTIASKAADENIGSKPIESDKNNDSALETKKRPARRRSAKLPKLDLNKAGIELIETKKANKVEEMPTNNKPKSRKKASWQNKEKASDDGGKIELIETKSTKKSITSKKPKALKKTPAKKTVKKD